MGWKTVTSQKRDALLASIPVHWRLSDGELRQATAHSDVRAALPVSRTHLMPRLPHVCV